MRETLLTRIEWTAEPGCDTVIRECSRGVAQHCLQRVSKTRGMGAKKGSGKRSHGTRNAGKKPFRRKFVDAYLGRYSKDGEGQDEVKVEYLCWAPEITSSAHVKWFELYSA